MKFIVALIPLWLTGIIFPPAVDSQYMDILQFVSLVWLPVVTLVVAQGRFLIGPAFRERTAIIPWTGASFVAITASAAMSADPLRSLAYVGAALVGIIACAGLWHFGRGCIAGGLYAYAMVASVFAVYIYTTGPRLQGRLSLSMTSHPNYLGLVVYGALVCSLFVPNRIVRATLIAVDFVVIVATESRGSLVAAFLALLTYATLKVIRLRRGRAAFVIAAAALLAAALLVYRDPIEGWVSDVLFLNDRYRGLGTGFTGRVEAWQEALDLYFANPWFGVGFRMHEQYMTTLSSAHNGYLSLLAEVGSTGTFSLLVLTLLGCARLLRRALRGDDAAAVGMSFVVGYLFLATFERFFLNMGNPTSVIAWLFLLIPEGGRLAPKPLSRDHLRFAVSAS